MSSHTPQEPPGWALEKIRKQFKYCPNMRRNAVKRVSPAEVGYGTVGRNGYIQFNIWSKIERYGVYAHHIAFYLYRHRYEWPTQAMDHINGDKLDNRISNLRLATTSQNGMNRGAQSNNTSGYPCVSWHKGNKRWRVQLVKDSKSHHFGYFTDYNEAVAVAKRERRRLFGRFDPGH